MNGLGINNLGITKAHVTGFVIGVGVSATGYYLYMKNKDSVDEFLAGYGIKMPTNHQEDLQLLTLEELMLKKEHIEDLIAEREMEVTQPVIVSE